MTTAPDHRLPCRQARRLLSAQLDGELTDRQAHCLRLHLESCTTCQAERAALQETDTLAHGALGALRRETLAGAPPVRATASLDAALDTHGGGAAWPVRRLTAGLALAAAVLVVILVGLPDAPVPPESASRLSPAALSCEIDPRGIRIHWEEIAPPEITRFLVLRYDSDGNVTRLETEDRQMLDDQVRPGEEYFYVVRGLQEQARYADLAAGSASVHPQDGRTWIRYEGGSEHVAYIKVSFEEEGEVFSSRFLVRAGERIGGPAPIPGRGTGDFTTSFVLGAIRWNETRFVTRWEEGRPVCREVPGHAVEILTPAHTVLTLWMREESSRDLPGTPR